LPQKDIEFTDERDQHERTRNLFDGRIRA